MFIKAQLAHVLAKLLNVFKSATREQLMLVVVCDLLLTQMLDDAS
jgi:hypothetical protein